MTKRFYTRVTNNIKTKKKYNNLELQFHQDQKIFYCRVPYCMIIKSYTYSIKFFIRKMLTSKSLNVQSIKINILKLKKMSS